MSTPTKKVPYVRLGNSGLKISKLIMGTMQYGSPEWEPWVLGEEEAIQHIKAAYDLGIQTFDTSDAYSNGNSEIILGKAIKQLKLPRPEIVVITKGYHIVARTPGESWITNPQNHEDFGYVNQRGTSRKHLFDAIKASLERLQLDYVDVYMVHRFDPNTPIAETMHALHDIVKAGYARYIGMSSCWAWQFHAMQNYAINNGLTPFICMENHHNLVYREEEREMIPTIKHFGVGAIPWSPLARGLLTRPYDTKGSTKRGTTDWLINGYMKGAGTAEIAKRVEEIACKMNVTMAQVAVAWTLSKDHVSAPIVGTTNIKNLQDIIGGLDVKLSPEDIKYLEEPYQPLPTIGFK